ncbi:MAG TPA: c-type cytochrome [Anaerolineales bacterium]|nr:c-type cytochrome [Anaerolineales bacterium]
MINTLKVSAFILIVVAAITGFASLIPQLESPAPKVLEITGELSGPELAAVGQTVFESPETGCLSCHAVGREGLRAPDLAGIGAAAGERIPGKSAEEYLHESIVTPCAHVIEGFDCIMPPTLLQTLGEAKVTAVIAYLQSLGGEVTITLSAEAAAGGTEGGSVGVEGITPEEILTNAGCVACHTIEIIGAAGVVGPNLSQVGTRLTPDEIRRSILDPDAALAEECPKKDEAGNLTSSPCLAGIMPKDFGQKLNAAQLEMLVLFLSELKGNE